MQSLLSRVEYVAGSVHPYRQIDEDPTFSASLIFITGEKRRENIIATAAKIRSGDEGELPYEVFADTFVLI